MSEGIDYKKDGTIVVRLDKAYVVKVPIADDVLAWDGQVQDQVDEVQETLDDYRTRLDELDDDSAEYRKLEREFKRFSRTPNHEFTLRWLQTVFDKQTDEFPPRSEWPAWLLDQLLPIRFSNHWKKNPLASGAEPNLSAVPNDG